MPEILCTVGPLQLTRYGVCCALAMLAGLLAISCRMRRQHYGYAVWIRLSACLIPMVLLFSRLFFVVTDYIAALAESSKYLNTWGNPFLGLRFWDGGYSMTGAIIGAGLSALIAAKWCGVSRHRLSDAVSVGIPAAILVERLAEIGTGLGEGRPLPEGFEGVALIRDASLMTPVCIYEALTAALILAALLAFARRQKIAGDQFYLLLVLYGLTQVLMESLRDDGHMVAHFLRIQQVGAILFVLWAMLRWTLKLKNDGPVKAAAWTVTLICIGVAVVAEFGVDRWGNRALAYGLLTGSLLLIAVAVLTLRRLVISSQEVS